MVVVAIENAVATLAMLAMVVLPLVEIAVRRLFGVGVPASGPIVQHLTLWVGFLGAAIAAREGKLLALATGTFIPAGTPRRVAGVVAAAAKTSAMRRGVPAGMNVPVASASSLPSRAAMAAPRNPTQSVRC